MYLADAYPFAAQMHVEMLLCIIMAVCFVGLVAWWFMDD